MTSRRARRAAMGGRDDRGSSTVEAAVAVPVALLLLLLVVQAGVYFHTRAVAVTAAHKGLDAARVEDGSADAGQAAAQDFLARHAAGLEDPAVSVERGADVASVQVSGDVVSVLFGLDLFPVRVSARAPVEQVRP